MKVSSNKIHATMLSKIVLSRCVSKYTWKTSMLVLNPQEDMKHQ
jgi:hypothetical protein